MKGVEWSVLVCFMVENGCFLDHLSFEIINFHGTYMGTAFPNTTPRENRTRQSGRWPRRVVEEALFGRCCGMCLHVILWLGTW